VILREQTEGLFASQTAASSLRSVWRTDTLGDGRRAGVERKSVSSPLGRDAATRRNSWDRSLFVYKANIFKRDAFVRQKRRQGSPPGSAQASGAGTSHMTCHDSTSLRPPLSRHYNCYRITHEYFVILTDPYYTLKVSF